MAKRGRPSKAVGELKSATVSFRVTEQLRHRIEEARRAEVPMRTFSQECEARLIRSFEEGQRVEDAFGGPTTSALLQVMAEHIVGIEKSVSVEGGKSCKWWNDRYTFDECVRFINKLLPQFVPTGRRNEPRIFRNYDLGARRALIAASNLQMIFQLQPEQHPLGRRLANKLVPKMRPSAASKFNFRGGASK